MPGLWNGPWMVTGYQSGAQIVFEPNPHWPGPKPAFRKVTLRTIENTAALQANLLSGDIDMVAGEGVGLTIDQALALRKQAPDRFVYAFQPSLSTSTSSSTTPSCPTCGCAAPCCRRWTARRS